MSDIETNKRIAQEFFADMNSQDRLRIQRAVDRLAEDATYWIQGHDSIAGTYSKADIARMVTAQTGFFAEPLTLIIHGITAEAHRVAVEMETKGRFVDGRPYNNTYHWLIEVRPDGRIGRVKEYCDTGYAAQAFAPLRHPPGGPADRA